MILTTGELKKGVVFTTPLMEMRRVELLSNNLSTRTSTSVVCYYYSLKNKLTNKLILKVAIKIPAISMARNRFVSH